MIDLRKVKYFYRTDTVVVVIVSYTYKKVGVKAREELSALICFNDVTPDNL